MSEHQQYLERCLALAEKAAADGESPVGSVLVKDGKIIGEGYEKSRQLKDITRHAEVVAVLDAVQKGEDVSGSVLYSNVEPCILCSYAIRHYKIKEVVFVKYSGELGGTREPFNILTTTELRSWSQPPTITVL
ncbi:tRNA-specific adenosine deaminase [Niastella yeongjuensis]|uniref:tRNA-specific adenosine deaminase n=1 Tax=Niastella yeongjuensis TaxID=354355 RepID=A0A1V9E3K8_9BACT|nr:nucleoside deaminase [Niastella yeongjuensis]OQP40713.1 tRNA-specific adenosine deaminase [Niastella yeongjuensis]SEP03906.1 tRNA(adenine34) deaminase [Niastella yeongjuensis]